MNRVTHTGARRARAGGGAGGVCGREVSSDTSRARSAGQPERGGGGRGAFYFLKITLLHIRQDSTNILIVYKLVLQAQISCGRRAPRPEAQVPYVARRGTLRPKGLALLTTSSFLRYD